MTDHDRPRAPRPIPVTEAVRDLIRHSAADHPAEHAAGARRTFVADGVEWFARVAGAGSGGTGSLAPALLVAVQFFHSEQPERPRREILLPRGRFEHLYDAELLALLHSARPLDFDDEPA